MAKYTFPLTAEETYETDAQYTLCVDGKKTKVNIQICGSNEFCVSVNNLDDETHPHVKHVGFAHSVKEACRIAVKEHLFPATVV